ncbi:hypothetical protein V1506DRAFT_104226 [Lipomyces tetrasporus]
MASIKPVAIVTGACSGIGLALTKHLLKRDYIVAMFGVNPFGASVSAELGPDKMFVQCDVTSWSEQAAAFKAVFTKFGHIDFVAPNAGISDKSSTYMETEDEKTSGEPSEPFIGTINVDYIAVIFGIKLATFYMKRNSVSGGLIVATASAAGLYKLDVSPLYASAKYGVRVYIVQCILTSISLLNHKC